MNQEKFVVRKATHIGRGHFKGFTNRQDALSLFNSEVGGARLVVGIICDGCSEGSSSEVGATLAAQLLARATVKQFSQGVPSHIIPNLLYSELLGSMHNLLLDYSFSSYSDRVNFIKNHLLFTVVGFILTDDELVVFYTGDGSVIVNDEVSFIDADDKPIYPAYHLVDRNVLDTNVTSLPESFEVFRYSTQEVDRFAIGSDAWHRELDLIDQIWGFSNPNGLQRRLNVWSEKDHRFYDDVSIITVEIEVDEPITQYSLVQTMGNSEVAEDASSD